MSYLLCQRSDRYDIGNVQYRNYLSESFRVSRVGVHTSTSMEHVYNEVKSNRCAVFPYNL
jgi:hypothetical protein